MKLILRGGVLLVVLGVIFLFLGRLVGAQDEVRTLINASYEVDERGKTKALIEIAIENLVSERYAKGFEMSFEGTRPANIRAYEGKNELRVEVGQEGASTLMKIEFDKAVVGRGKTRTFTLSFEDDSYVTRMGDVWELNLPRISEVEKFEAINVELTVSHLFGELAYISPEPLGKIESGTRYIFYFNKEKLIDGGINLAFGEFQVYAFSLVYHLENPVKNEVEIEIAIPPDTAFQRLIYEQIIPEPINVVVDRDGNWLAKYKLKGRERIDVKTMGKVQIFAEPRELGRKDDDYLNLTREAHNYWQADDLAIKKLAEELGSPREIYDYVLERLDYSYDRVKPNAKRMGAIEALKNPDEAMCMEFTDLFITLCRAAGIAAREVNGYAYTENPELQPLSLVADVLHSWPEYWDERRKTWIGVDPTWGDTTGGEDFFNKLDLRHFAFVIHGVDSEKPYSPGSYKLGANPQKDVYVSFSGLAEVRGSKPQIVIEKNSGVSFSNLKYFAKITNPGPTALYDLETKTLFDEIEVDKQKIEVIAPYGFEAIEISMPGGLMGFKLPNKLTLVVDEKQAEVLTNKSAMILPVLTVVLLFILIVTLFLVRLIKIKK